MAAPAATPAPRPLPAPPPEVVPPAGRRAPPESQPRTVQLTIRAQPRDATVTLDGKVLAGNPFQGEFPLERRTHVVQVSAPGFATAERIITLAEDTKLDVSLVANRVRHAPARRREAARPTVSDGESRRIEPGMELKRPAANTPRRQIDEKDPYAP